MSTRYGLIMGILSWGILSVISGGCGGSQDTGAAPTYDTTVEAEPDDSRRSDMDVSGIIGTIPTHMIQDRFELKLFRFERCFTDRESAVPFIGGHFEFYLRVALDGSVRWIYPRDSTIGDRQVERCLVDIVARSRFPQPRGGGEAEFAWGFDRDPDEEVRPPVEWSEGDVNAAIRENAGSIRQCGIGAATYKITAYVAPGGEVMAAGASASDQSSADEASLDCVTDAVLGWAMPDPGSYPAKVTFSAP